MLACVFDVGLFVLHDYFGGNMYRLGGVVGEHGGLFRQCPRDLL